jgi:hypothetical protein
MEAADATVSIDLLLRALLALAPRIETSPTRSPGARIITTPVSRQSMRKARMGSARDARRAGSRLAARATIMVTVATIVKVAASVGEMP